MYIWGTDVLICASVVTNALVQQVGITEQQYETWVELEMAAFSVLLYCRNDQFSWTRKTSKTQTRFPARYRSVIMFGAKYVSSLSVKAGPRIRVTACRSWIT